MPYHFERRRALSNSRFNRFNGIPFHHQSKKIDKSMVLRLLESNEDHHLTNHKIVLKVPFKSQLFNLNIVTILFIFTIILQKPLKLHFLYKNKTA